MKDKIYKSSIGFWGTIELPPIIAPCHREAVRLARAAPLSTGKVTEMTFRQFRTRLLYTSQSCEAKPLIEEAIVDMKNQRSEIGNHK